MPLKMKLKHCNALDHCWMKTTLPRIEISQDVHTKPCVVSFCSALLKVPGPAENDFWAMALRQ